MERREFCRFAGVCGLALCAGGISGCARLLERAARDETSPTSSTAEATTPGTPTSTPPADGSGAWPDLAVFAGDDPGRNVREALARLGGMERFVKRGARVVVKPNLVTGRAPEFATCTNPLVVASVVRMCLEAGADTVTVLDRPTSSATTAYQVSGVGDAVEQAGGRMKYLTDRNFERVEIPQGVLLKDWPFVTDVFEADTFINIPIAKTHDMAKLTMAMKNLMGTMGDDRGVMHQDFAQKISDVNSLVRPDLVILDAYRMLVRNGPTGGSLRDVRVAKTVVAGTNQASVDAFGATLFGMRPADLDYLTVAAQRGLGVIDLGRLSIVKGTA